MELGKQIKMYRSNLKLSQDQLAEKVFVSRQTISNWENDKSYPDIKSLLLLSEVFEVTLDILVKGDLEEMKNKINNEDIREFEKVSWALAVCMAVMVLSAFPLVHFLKIAGIAIWCAILAVTMVVAYKAEKLKKQNDIQTYREITAFLSGDSLKDTDKIQEKAKAPYQRVLMALGSALITLAVFAVMVFIFK